MHSVDVLRADGRCFPVPIASLQSRLSADPGLILNAKCQRMQHYSAVQCSLIAVGFVSGLSVGDLVWLGSSRCFLSDRIHGERLGAYYQCDG